MNINSKVLIFMIMIGITSGNPSSILWTLSFQKINRNDANKPSKEMLIHLTANIDYLNHYNISSISTVK